MFHDQQTTVIVTFSGECKKLCIYVSIEIIVPFPYIVNRISYIAKEKKFYMMISGLKFKEWVFHILTDTLTKA